MINTPRTGARAAGLFATLLLMTLAGCDQPQAPARSLEETKALRPADARLSAIYERACMTCHVDKDTGAPLTGDEPAWAPRRAKGLEALMDNTINGFNGMPPLGLCMDCTAADFEALIAFMSAPETD